MLDKGRLFLIAVVLVLGFGLWMKVGAAGGAGNKVVASEIQGTIPPVVVNNGRLTSATRSAIDNSTATYAGEMRLCTDCGAAGGRGTVCVSTQATGFHGFVLSTGTICI